MTKALVCVMNNRTSQKSVVHKLYGDPDQYAYKFANSSFANELPIHQNAIRFSGYGYLHYLSIDNNEHRKRRIYFSNNFDGRLEYGHFVYQEDGPPNSFFFDIIPDTRQVPY